MADEIELTEDNIEEVAEITGRPADALRSGLASARARKQRVHVSLHRPWWRES